MYILKLKTWKVIKKNFIGFMSLHKEWKHDDLDGT